MEREHGSLINTESSMMYNADPLAEGKLSGKPSNSSFSQSPSGGGQKDVHDDSLTKSQEDSLRPLEVGYTSLPEVNSKTSEWSMINEYPPMEAGGLSSQPDVWLQTPERSPTNALSMQSPPLQTMEQPEGYDPNRIPASVFSSKPTTPAEWSTTSNESLFSIYVGDNSFCKDPLMFGKSGELTKCDDFSNSPLLVHSFHKTKRSETYIQSNLPSVPEVVVEHDGRNDREEDSRSKEDAATLRRVGLKETSDDHNVKSPSARASSCSSDSKSMLHFDQTHPSPNTPRLSNASAHSASSFAFPILAGDYVKEGSVNPVFQNKQSKPQSLESKPQPQDKIPKSTQTCCWFSFSCCPLRCCL